MSVSSFYMIENDFLYTHSYILNSLLQQDDCSQSKCVLPELEFDLPFSNYAVYNVDATIPNGDKLSSIIKFMAENDIFYEDGLIKNAGNIRKLDNYDDLVLEKFNELLIDYGYDYCEEIIKCAADQFFVLRNLIKQVEVVGYANIKFDIISCIKQYYDEMHKVMLDNFDKNKESLSEQEQNRICESIENFESCAKDRVLSPMPEKFLVDKERLFMNDQEKDPNNFLKVDSELSSKVKQRIISNYSWNLLGLTINSIPDYCIDDVINTEEIKQLIKQGCDKILEIFQDDCEIIKTRLHDIIPIMENAINSNDIFGKLANEEIQKQEKLIDKQKSFMNDIIEGFLNKVEEIPMSNIGVELQNQETLSNNQEERSNLKDFTNFFTNLLFT